MSNCLRCNGQGHLGIRIAVDDYTTCPECGGSGEVPENTVAVQEPLSELVLKILNREATKRTQKFYGYSDFDLAYLDAEDGWDGGRNFDLLDF